MGRALRRSIMGNMGKARRCADRFHLPKLCFEHSLVQVGSRGDQIIKGLEIDDLTRATVQKNNGVGYSGLAMAGLNRCGM